MLLFFSISFAAGILTVLAPCILPILPVIIGGSVVGGSKSRAYTVIGSLILSIVLFTLLIKVSSLFIDVSPDTWKYISGIILFGLGITFLFPQIWESIPGLNAFSVSANKLLGKGMMQNTFLGDVLMGAALGPVFSTCSPTYFIILATVLPSHLTLGLVYLFAYSIGLGLALLAISLFGQKLVDRLNVTADTHGVFKRSIGAIFIAIALLIITGYDKKVQVWVSAHVFDVTKLEQRLLQTTEQMDTSKNENTFKTDTAGEAMPSLGVYHEITDPSGFVNTNGQPIKLGDYIGKKIILVDFLTYSCINCIRTFPYLIDWDAKYRDQGLLTVGIHTPEFAFEKNINNVEQAMKKEGITFPIVLDNNYGTWNAYKNQFWPRKFIIDLNGNIVFDHIGEGNYEETENVIRKLLMTIPGNTKVDAPLSKELENIAPKSGITNETYLGYARLSNYAGTIKTSCEDSLCTFETPSVLPLNEFSFGGEWVLDSEFATGKANSSLIYHAVASKVHFVAAPAKDGGKVIIQVSVDGVKTKIITIDHSDLYTLSDGNEKKEQTVMIKVISGDLEAYTFTFS